MSLNKPETKRYGVVVFFLNFAYLRIVYVTRINIIYLLSMYRYFQSDNKHERAWYGAVVFFLNFALYCWSW